MNHLRTEVDGVDEPIKALQKYLYDNIVSYYDLNAFNGYGRVYKNKRNDMIVPEYYVSNKQYKEVLLDSRLDGIMFFSTSSTSKAYGTLVIQPCDVMFTFNLSRLTDDNERDDEQVRQYVLWLLNQYTVNLGDKEIETDLRYVYRDYNGVSAYFYDMQPFHHFKIKIELRYNNKIC